MNPVAHHPEMPVDDAYGPYLKPGLIVQISTPGRKNVGLSALSAGELRLTCSDVVAGIREGHVSELESLGFFDVVEEQLGRTVRPGHEDEIESDELDTLVAILDQITPQATPGVRCLISRLSEMSVSAAREQCSIGFLL
jgi:hypothetical protein